MYRNISLIVTLLPILALTACTTNQTQPSAAPTRSTVPVSHGGEVKDQVSFIDNLREKGIEVTFGDPVEQPFLQAKGSQLILKGNALSDSSEIQAYNYDDADLKTDGLKAAESDAAEIDASGDPITSKILWVGGPHWFRKDRLMVLYAGDDANTIKVLEDLLGKQFAGK
ncbi:MAG: hypothetical protein M3Q44_08355 [bacterium]|nr:hypothetical protein [bacterium]